jgi:CheY-like chemotaxis protein
MVVKELMSVRAESPDKNSPKSRPSILVVDDDAGLLVLFKVVLSEDYRVKTARNGLDALNAIEKEQFDAIVLDMRMPVLDGPGFFRELRARGDRTPVLVTSSYGAIESRRELGAEAAIEKPFEPDQLLEVVGRLVS